jgi:hypothetical protein
MFNPAQLGKVAPRQNPRPRIFGNLVQMIFERRAEPLQNVVVLFSLAGARSTRSVARKSLTHQRIPARHVRTILVDCNNHL